MSSARPKPLIAVGIALGVVVVLFFVGIITARHWTKTDVPEHAETFHSETQLTGYYSLTDDGVNPCWVGENYTLCINSYVDNYNATCAAYPLTYSAQSACDSRSQMIDNMQAKNSYGSYVSGLGGAGLFIAVPETETVDVTNNDYRPAVTHEASCYLGFIGECK